MIKLKQLLPLLIITAVLILSGCSKTKIPQADKGILDLSAVDLKSSPVIPLRGEWEFCWKEYVGPLDPMPADSILTVIPSFWEKTDYNGRVLPGTGYATYRLHILLPETDSPVALKIRPAFSSYRMYIDGYPASESGVPGKSRDSTEPYFHTRIIPFQPESQTVTLTFHVANYHLLKGGLWENIVIGDAERVTSAGIRHTSYEIFLISCIFVMAVYHLGIFLNRKEDRTSLYFGIFSMLIALRSMVTGDVFITDIFTAIPWLLVIKIEYVSFYAAPVIFLLYLENLFPRDVNHLVIRISQGIAAVFCLLAALTPPWIFTRSLLAFQAVTGASGLYIIYILIKTVRKKRESSISLLIGFIFMFLVVINDVLHSNQLIHTGFFLSTGFVVFIFFQALLILRRFTQAHLTVEKQKNELISSHELFERSRLGTILGLAKLAEYRDEDTGTHLERIREYCKILAGRLAETEKYSGYITARYIDDLFQSSILHDIGKVGVPDSVLLKPGKLNDEEFNTIKKHTSTGGDALQNIEAKTNMKSFLTLGKEIAYHHHEKWDGSGYPAGLSGEKIPLSARITAVADVYDALTSVRPYKSAFSHSEAVKIILDGDGSHFDPEIIDAFRAVEKDFERIRSELLPED